MAADYPENYEAHMDAFQFIRDVPVDWDDSKILEAEPGDFITIARKEKGKNNWFAGAITDENARTATLPLSFLEKGQKYVATLYGDAPGSSWSTNPEGYKIDQFVVDNSKTLRISIAPGGGAAISLIPASVDQLKTIKPYK